MSDIAQKVRNVLKVGVVVGALQYGGLTWMFGAEPMIMSGYVVKKTPVPEFTFKDYRQMSEQVNGDTLYARAMPYVAYPGAKIGRVLANIIIEHDK